MTPSSPREYGRSSAASAAVVGIGSAIALASFVVGSVGAADRRDRARAKEGPR
jgi:hypothetical protein